VLCSLEGGLFICLDPKMNLLESPDPTWMEVEEFASSWEMKDDTFMVVRVLDKKAGTLNERAFTSVKEAVHYVDSFDTDDYEVTHYTYREMVTSIELAQ
jgi:hypothetical protein